MKTSIATTVVVTLVLSKEEADWLHNQMQNPLHGQDCMKELTEDGEMRLKFFNATNTFK